MVAENKLGTGVVFARTVNYSGSPLISGREARGFRPAIQERSASACVILSGNFNVASIVSDKKESFEYVRLL